MWWIKILKRNGKYLSPARVRSKTLYVFSGFVLSVRNSTINRTDFQRKTGYEMLIHCNQPRNGRCVKLYVASLLVGIGVLFPHSLLFRSLFYVWPVDCVAEQKRGAMSFSTVMRDDRICVTQQSLTVLDHRTTLFGGLLSCGDTVIYYTVARWCFISDRFNNYTHIRMYLGVALTDPLLSYWIHFSCSSLIRLPCLSYHSKHLQCARDTDCVTNWWLL
jgi:hypothetical protein